MLFSHIPLKEIKGWIILAGHGGMSQFINFLGDQLFMLIGGAEQLIKRAVFGKRRCHVINARQAAGIRQVIKQTLHVRHLFLGMTTQEGGRTFKAVIAAPGAHLLIKQGRKQLKIHLRIELVDHFIF